MDLTYHILRDFTGDSIGTLFTMQLFSQPPPLKSDMRVAEKRGPLAAAGIHWDYGRDEELSF